MRTIICMILLACSLSTAKACDAETPIQFCRSYAQPSLGTYAPHSRRAKIAHARWQADHGEVVANPVGCPRTNFCACGAALYVFHRNIRSLWPVSAWGQFPLASAARGMAAIWGHRHIAIIIEAHGDGTATVYDANSGHHQTRIHRRSLAGATIRNPNVAFN